MVIATACNYQGKKEHRFIKLSPEYSGIYFQNSLEESEEFNIIEYLYYYNGGGVAVGDINNDGLSDIYFTANEKENKLYLNKGNLEFQDITISAGVEMKGPWKTGVSMADVNGDGFLDIYVCRVSNYKGLVGHNELYINNGNLTFTERSKTFGLNFRGFSTHSAFFDMDNDGDLDMYLLNHAVHTRNSYGTIALRNEKDSLSGDRIYENDNGIFRNTTSTSGIYNSHIGYGLGVGLADINQDGYTDIYVSNDFSENDYLYLNNGNKTFTESLSGMAHHTSKFSMGNDLTDYNNDGLIDIITLDMLPNDEIIRKKSTGDDSYEISTMKLSFGYMNQYSRNSLLINRGNGKFSDIAMLTGVHATDWSWAPLLADFDNDGWKDLFISNGTEKRPNDLDYIDFISNDKVRNPAITNADFIAEMPDGRVPNYFFTNNRNLTFKDVTSEWFDETSTVTNGTVYADLDNDGDLELIQNNLKSEAQILKNLTREQDSAHTSFLTIRFKGDSRNTSGIGAKLYLYIKDHFQFYEHFVQRGFQSTVDNKMVIGLGATKLIDSLVVVWPSGKAEKRQNIEVNREIILVASKASISNGISSTQENQLFKAAGNYGLDFIHKENKFVEFNREAIIPHMNSQEGPVMAIGDVNGDGASDIYIGGAKNQSGELFVQNNGEFISAHVFKDDQLLEDVDAHFFDIENDGDLDLIVVSGGNEFDNKSKNQLSRIYHNNGSGWFERDNSLLTDIFETGSVAAIHDFNDDGYQDIFLGSLAVPWNYGLTPESHLMLNREGKSFEKITGQFPDLSRVGMVKDAKWADIDGNGEKDLVVAALWQPIKVFYFESGKLKHSEGLRGSNGLWQTIEILDFDHDGDNDIIGGNLGLNSKLKASLEEPLTLYLNDFDGNGKLDQILTYYKDGVESIFVSRQDLGKQLVKIKKNFTDYDQYAHATVSELLGQAAIDTATQLKVFEMRTGVYINKDGDFEFNPMSFETQFSVVTTILVDDFNADGHDEILLAGNFYPVAIQQGRYSEDYGSLYVNHGNADWTYVPNKISGLYLEGQIRDIKFITIKEVRILIAARNNESLQLFNTRK